MYSEAEKEEDAFSLGKRVHFAGCHQFSDALLDGTTPTQYSLDYDFSTYLKIGSSCNGIASSTNLSGPKNELLLWNWEPGII